MNINVFDAEEVINLLIYFQYKADQVLKDEIVRQKDLNVQIENFINYFGAAIANIKWEKLNNLREYYDKSKLSEDWYNNNFTQLDAIYGEKALEFLEEFQSKNKAKQSYTLKFLEIAESYKAKNTKQQRYTYKFTDTFEHGIQTPSGKDILEYSIIFFDNDNDMVIHSENIFCTPDEVDDKEFAHQIGMAMVEELNRGVLPNCLSLEKVIKQITDFENA
ncbi:TPA: hypothetical protein MW242_003088 [Acinetobacter baumannii]|nr:hypothetical protein [Acinetobacter baumannii]